MLFSDELEERWPSKSDTCTLFLERTSIKGKVLSTHTVFSPETCPKKDHTVNLSPI